ncbi:MAG: molybdopterin-synthase adenylyltransferase MoeB [Alcanivoracaceae bacterium]|nr:molybdopterin-synthase adenylyltransferase MoeB [Alcanivoracaceae bacterium]
MLSDDQLLRYSRHILLDDIDLAGQEKLFAASVLIIGAGGLANPAALYLAGAGVGRLLIADGDTLEVSNLQRQIGFRQSDVGSNKAQALVAQLAALNDSVQLQAHPQFVDQHWLAEQLHDVDVVLDCSDNFATRAMVNGACVAARVPLVSGAAIRFSGQLAVFDLRRDDAACYACLYGSGESRDELCSESGILGPVVGTMGTLQALQAIRLICGLPVAEKLQLFDGHTLEWKSLGFRKDPACPVCGLQR